MLLTGYNLLQHYQYHTGILSAWDMNFSKYRYVFLKTAARYRYCLGGNEDIIPYKAHLEPILEASNDFERTYPYFGTPYTIDHGAEHNRVCDYTNREYNFSIDLKADSTFLGDRGIYAEIALDRFELTPWACTSAMFTIEMTDTSGTNFTYYAFRINEFPSETIQTWKRFTYHVELTHVREPGDQMKMYIWNPGRKAFLIDNVVVKLYRII